MLNVNLEHVWPFISKGEFEEMEPDILKSQDLLMSKLGAGNDFLGWLDWPATISDGLVSEVIDLAESLREQIDYLVVIGIGGPVSQQKIVCCGGDFKIRNNN